MHAVCFSLKLIIMLIKQMYILKILASLIMKFGNVSPYEQKLSDYKPYQLRKHFVLCNLSNLTSSSCVFNNCERKIGCPVFSVPR